jgi:hypothetical protein
MVHFGGVISSMQRRWHAVSYLMGQIKVVENGEIVESMGCMPSGILVLFITLCRQRVISLFAACA